MLPPDPTPDSKSRIALRGVDGKDVLVHYLSIGAWSWGPKATFNYNPTRDLQRIHAAWTTLKSVGLTFVGTAQSYGDSESQRIFTRIYSTAIAAI
ncbi:Aldo/keto reductase subgroup [Penicillium concentricum]|uniref:Aldo/keto reductase subgroup n=1 Tax=Penicillium concentricum TaxID=293559 RepID=A0A9W9SUJ7_9EURO|nr:Aldo/keto reductase subgroup [Penicillium concentricum]KAJ5384771.1 Aldo/keto reductase subgroup [Penicillium concentricum]